MPGDGIVTPVDVHRRMRGIPPIGYETFPDDLRTKVVARFPHIDLNEQIAKPFLGGVEGKAPSTEGMCNEDICAQFVRNYKRNNFYEQIQNSLFQNSYWREIIREWKSI
jgi:hypothetical protein